MASTYTSRLKLERQGSGENSGNWGNLVNYVFNRVDSSIRGYQAVSVAGSANVTLTSNNSTTNTDDSTTDDQVHNAVLEFTGTLTGNILADLGRINVAGIANNTSSTYFTLPSSDGSADQVLKTNGSGALSFATVSGGAAWQAVKTSGFTAVAKEGYFCNTTSSAFTATLPVSATIGDFISFVDYAGTFDTNNLTIGRNGHNIQGLAEDLTVNQERAGLTLVYVDATQGWLLQNN
jgi:hypothetical protein